MFLAGALLLYARNTAPTAHIIRPKLATQIRLLQINGKHPTKRCRLSLDHAEKMSRLIATLYDFNGHLLGRGSTAII